MCFALKNSDDIYNRHKYNALGPLSNLPLIY